MTPKARIAAWIAAGALGSAAGVVGYWEGFVPYTYADPIGIPTVCYGQTGTAAYPGAVYTREQCDAMLTAELRHVIRQVAQCTEERIELAPHEVAALVSFTYNVGGGAFCRSTMARKINAGAPPQEWCAELRKWVYANGRKLRGLERRREAEHALCVGSIN